MRKWIGFAAAVLVIAGGIYGGSPYYAVHALRTAALGADTDALAAEVDFPAVRESLKSQAAAAMITRMRSDPDLRDNPLAGLGALLLPAIADRLVDTVVTPDGIAALIRGRNPADGASPAPNPDMKTRSGYLSLDRFRVRLHNVRSGEDGPSFVFERRGFADWKLVKIELPPKLFAQTP